MADFLSTPLGDCAWIANVDLQGGARAAAFFGSYMPALLAVAFLSTPRLRKQWAFRILVLALAISMGKDMLEMQMLVWDVGQVDITADYYKVWNPLINTAFFVQWYVPWICDCALLCKLLAFHPASTTPSKRRAAIMAFPLAMHLPRIPLLIASCVLTATRPRDHGNTSLGAFHLLVAEGALQVAENCYCSGFLLYKARQFALSDYAASNQQAQRARLGLRYFTESTLFTFLPASVLQTAWLITVSVRAPDPAGKLIRADNYLRMFNTSFSVNFGLLAVWWASARIHALKAGQSHSSQLQAGATKERESAQDMSMLYWALGPIELEESSSLNDGSDEVDHRNSLVDEPKSATAEEEE